MMHDVSLLLICSPNVSHVEQVAQKFHLKIENNPDVHVMESPITIEAVRSMISEMSLKPYQAEKSFYILPEIDQASLPAQNALLKSLEEPPSHAQLILTAQSPENVLPTIRSRCVIEKSSALRNTNAVENHNPEISELLKKIENGKFADIFEISEKYKEREDAIKLIDQIIFSLNAENEATPSAKTTQQLQKCIVTKNLLAKNVNVRLALEDLCFHF